MFTNDSMQFLVRGVRFSVSTSLSLGPRGIQKFDSSKNACVRDESKKREKLSPISRRKKAIFKILSLNTTKSATSTYTGFLDPYIKPGWIIGIYADTSVRTEL